MILSFKRDVDKKNPVDTLNDKWPKGGKNTHTQQTDGTESRARSSRTTCWLNRVPSIYLGRG
jgi:hypothetical protein